MSEHLDNLVRKYGAPAGPGRGVYVKYGNVEVPHNGRRVSLPGPAGAEYLKHSDHPHAPIVASLVAHPIQWTVGEKHLPVVQHFGPDELAKMAWADPKGSVVNVSGGIDHGDDAHNFSTMASASNGLSAVRRFDVKHKIVHQNSVQAPRQREPGWGTKKFLDALASYRRGGFNQIKIHSAEGHAHNESFNGYYTWPRLGFNGLIHPADVAALPEEFHHARTFHELFDTPGGAEAWKKHGGASTDLSFDTRDDSPHMRRLLSYLKTKRGE